MSGRYGKFIVVAVTVLSQTCLGQTTITADSLFDTVIGQDSGKNGYADFVRAAGLALDRDFQETLARVPNPGAPGWLTGQRNAVQTHLEILDRIEAGLRKPVQYPNLAFSLSQRFPELPLFRDIGHWLECKANVDFADGAPESAVAKLAMALDLGTAVAATGGLDHYRCGVAIHMNALATIDRNLSRITLEGSKRLQRSAELALRASQLTNNLVTERQALDKSVALLMGSGMKDELANFGLKTSTDGPSVPSRWSTLSAQERQTVMSAVLTEQGTRFDGLAAALREPESTWILGKGFPGLEPETPSDESPLGFLVMRLGAIDKSLLKVEAMHRVRLRLLRLHAKIIEYRWRTLKLPTDLGQLHDENAVKDPLTVLPFIYKVDSRKYELFSAGDPQSGPIGLVDAAAPGRPKGAGTSGGHS